MAIITISREIAALGDETAHELSKVLKYRFVDKAILEKRLLESGLSERKLEKFDERKPSIVAAFSQERDSYLHFLRTAMYEEALQGDRVFIGRGASAVFQGLPAVVSVRLVAPYDIRLERVKSYFRCDAKRARHIIDQNDRDRSGYHRYFFDADWNAPHNYMLTLNMGSIHPATAAGIVRDLVRLVVTPESEAQLSRRLQSMSVSQQILTRILYDRRIPIHFLEALVEDGAVTLQGVANSQASVEQALAAAREIGDTHEVRSEIQIVQEYTVLP